MYFPPEEEKEEMEKRGFTPTFFLLSLFFQGIFCVQGCNAGCINIHEAEEKEGPWEGKKEENFIISSEMKEGLYMKKEIGFGAVHI